MMSKIKYSWSLLCKLWIKIRLPLWFVWWAVIVAMGVVYLLAGAFYDELDYTFFGSISVMWALGMIMFSMLFNEIAKLRQSNIERLRDISDIYDNLIDNVARRMAMKEDIRMTKNSIEILEAELIERTEGKSSSFE